MSSRHSVFAARHPAASALLLAIAAAAGASAQAELLLYENYDGYANGDPAGKTVLAAGLTGSYTHNNTAGGTFSIVSGGLAFGALNSGGKHLQGNSSSGGSTLAAAIAPGIGVSGTLWNSYLVQLTQRSVHANSLSEVRVTNLVADTGGAARFRSVTNQSGTATATSVGYSSAGTSSGVSLALNQTYLLVSRYTNVGSAIPVGGGAATLFALTLPQYENFALSGFSESYLDTTATGAGADQIFFRVSATNTVATTYNFAAGNFVQMGILGGGGTNGTENILWDEVRYGTTLADVAIPEPATAGLLLLGTLALAMRRRRSRGVCESATAWR